MVIIRLKSKSCFLYGKKKTLNITKAEKLFEKLKNVIFFKKLLKNKFKHEVFELISNLKFKTFSKNEVIFKQFEKSEKFFTILKGKIYVLKKNKYEYSIKNNIRTNKFPNLKNDPFFFDQKTGQIKRNFPAPNRQYFDQRSFFWRIR